MMSRKKVNKISAVCRGDLFERWYKWPSCKCMRSINFTLFQISIYLFHLPWTGANDWFISIVTARKLLQAHLLQLLIHLI